MLEYWNDATEEKSLDEVRDIPDSLLPDLDGGMICNIQWIVSRLAAKVPQLIDKFLCCTEHGYNITTYNVELCDTINTTWYYDTKWV